MRASAMWAYKSAMRKSIHSPEYQAVLAKLIAMRKNAGLSQRDLAEKLNREHSFVWRIETGERRLDVVEFYWVCKALRQKAEQVYTELIRQFAVTHYDEPKSKQPLLKVADPSARYRVSKTRAKQKQEQP